MRRFNENCLLFLLCAFNYSLFTCPRETGANDYSFILKEEICLFMNTNVTNAERLMNSSSLAMMINYSVKTAQVRN
jgi:hypothetical protein